MSNWQVINPDFETRVRNDFAAQGIMQTLGAKVAEVAPGRVIVEQEIHDGLLQQYKIVHGGATSALLDSGCAFAALTLLPADQGITTIEFKTNFFAPGVGERLRCDCEVLKFGRTVQVSEGRAFAIKNGAEKLIATMTATMMAVTP